VALLGKKAMEPKLPDHPFIISSMGHYQGDEKSILEVIIQGKNNEKHNTIAMVNYRATEDFIDRNYAEQTGIPLDKKIVLR
jgi:hypothetical protein